MTDWISDPSTSAEEKVEHFESLEPVETKGPSCGGCRGLGAHQRLCPRHPDYHPWKRLVAMAEDIGDTIGSNDVEIANTAYQLSARIKAAMVDHPWRRRT